MSALRDSLLAQLQRFDDEAFVALANRGLLRRAYKDLEGGLPVVLEESAQYLLLGTSGQQVRFDERGPAFARCGCPATGVCQHLLAAALGLRAILQASPPAAAQAGEVDAPVEAPVVDAEHPGRMQELCQALLDLPHAELLKHAGKAGYRWAWQFTRDLDLSQEVRLGGELNLTIGFVHPPLTLRYMGGPLASMLADRRMASLERYQVAAVLVVQRLHGRDPVTPAPVGGAPGTASDPTSETASGGTAHGGREQARRRLRLRTRQLLQASVAVGLAHLSPAIQQRYVALSVWAQGADYHRLALSLRRLADQVQRQLARAAAADQQGLFDELTRCYGLVAALDSAAARGEEPARLVGQARSHYAPSGALEVWGLGASAWQSASGYVGLTMLFWSPAQQCFLSCSEARPAQQGRFNPQARYTAPGPWAGLGAPALATGRKVRLMGAQVNGEGRLSVAESVSATVMELPPGSFVHLPSATDWSALRQLRSARRRSLLTPAQPMKDWVVLQPARLGSARFDPTRQALVLPLYDRNEDILWVELAFSPYNQHAIARLEQLCAAPSERGRLWVARLYERADALIAEPLSLLQTGTSTVDALHFDPAPSAVVSAPFASDPEEGRGLSLPGDEPLAPRPVPHCLSGFRYWLGRQAERGADPHWAPGIERQLQDWEARMGTAGFSVIGREPAANLAARLIVAHYLCLQYEHLLGSDDSLAEHA